MLPEWEVGQRPANAVGNEIVGEIMYEEYGTFEPWWALIHKREYNLADALLTGIEVAEAS